MDFSKYSTEIQQIVEQLKAADASRDPAVLQHCATLVKAAQKTADPALLGYAYYHLAQASFFYNHYENFRKNLLRGMKYQQSVCDHDLLANSYNMLAIDAMNKGYTDLGLDFFLKALSFCDSKQSNYRAGVIHMNIAQVYIRLKMESTALQHLRQGIREIKRQPEHPFYRSNLIFAYCTAGECYLEMSKPAQAHKCMDRVLAYMASGEVNKADNLLTIPFHCFQAKLYHFDRDYQKRDESLVELVESLERTPSIADVFDDIFDLGSFILQIGRTELAHRMIQRLQASKEVAGIVSLKFRLADFRTQYYQQTTDRDGLYAALLDYYELSREMESDRIQSYQYSAEIQTAMEELRRKQMTILEENVQLTQQVETDALTELPNRYALNRFSDAAFERAYKNSSTLAVCILDVDHFKEYNDTYGHLEGDKCLHAIADRLSDMSGNSIFCARYGGDEFVVIYEGMTDEEVLAQAEQLRTSILEMKIPHSSSPVAPYVTISQGIRNSVPVKENRLWDFLFAADNALYHVKGTNKGGILLIHKTQVAESMFSN
jgi:diguanylate cyclase (GGDEF)-like protein